VPVAQDRHLRTIGSLIECANGNAINGSLEFDQWMRLVMQVDWASFTVGAKVGVVANSTLVKITPDIALARLVFAKRTVAQLPDMDDLGGRAVRKLVADSNKTMLWMNERCALDASRTIVPVRTIQTLMSDAYNTLLKEDISVRLIPQD
jgi:hypothetical protein